MEINRYLRKDRITKNDMVPIRLVVHYDNRRLPISTGEKVHRNGWDEDKNRVNGKQPFYLQINQKLNDMEAVLTVIYREAQLLQIELTENSYRETFQAVYDKLKDTGGDFRDDKIREEYEIYRRPKQELPKERAKKQPSFFELLDAWLLEEENKVNLYTGRKISNNTIKGIKSTIKRFREFEEETGHALSFEGMDKAFYAKFRLYMLSGLKQGINTFGKHIRRLKQFLAWCEDLDESLPVNRRYQRFEVPSIYVGVDALTPEEVNAIRLLNFKSGPAVRKVYYQYSAKMDSDMESKEFKAHLLQHELARDIFLMCCYTGLRISDALQLNMSQIRGDLIIIEEAQKTAGSCYIPYYDDEVFHPRALVEKYFQRGKGDKVFPETSDVLVNRHLKFIQKLACITRFDLTTKIGRKTFVTLKIYQGVPTRVIMQATGHKSETAFARYAGINEGELVEAFRSRSIAK